MAETYPVVVSAGSLRAAEGVAMSHRWTDAGVMVESDFTGGHLLHLAVAGCVLNDTFREGLAMGVRVEGVRVIARGEFDTGWSSTGIEYVVEVDSPAGPDAVAALLARVDEVSEIPRAVRAGGPVTRWEPGSPATP